MLNRNSFHFKIKFTLLLWYHYYCNIITTVNDSTYLLLKNTSQFNTKSSITNDKQHFWSERVKTTKEFLFFILSFKSNSHSPGSINFSFCLREIYVRTPFPFCYKIQTDFNIYPCYLIKQLLHLTYLSIRFNFFLQENRKYNIRVGKMKTKWAMCGRRVV